MPIRGSCFAFRRRSRIALRFVRATLLKLFVFVALCAGAVYSEHRYFFS